MKEENIPTQVSKKSGRRRDAYGTVEEVQVDRKSKS
jgi:hypothetical protein